MNVSREWLLAAAESEDGCEIGVGGMAWRTTNTGDTKMDDDVAAIAKWISRIEAMGGEYPDDAALRGGGDLRSMLMDDLRRCVSAMRLTAGIPKVAVVMDDECAAF